MIYNINHDNFGKNKFVIDNWYENFSFYLDMYVLNHKDVDH
jgi:hypothetical protein